MISEQINRLFGITAQRDVVAEHQELADVALSRNTDKAVDLLTNHYQRTKRLLTETAPRKAK